MHVKDTSQTYHKLLILQNHTKSISYRYANSIKNAFFVHLCTNMSLQQPILEGCSPHTYLELLQPLSSFPQNPWYLGLRSSQKARFLSWWFQVISRNVSGASLRPWMMGILCVKWVPFFVNLKPTQKKKTQTKWKLYMFTFRCIISSWKVSHWYAASFRGVFALEASTILYPFSGQGGWEPISSRSHFAGNQLPTPMWLKALEDDFLTCHGWDTACSSKLCFSEGAIRQI